MTEIPATNPSAEANLLALARMYGEACGEAARFNGKLGELNATVAECLPSVETLIAERETAEAALAQREAEIARLQDVLIVVEEQMPSADFTPRPMPWIYVPVTWEAMAAVRAALLTDQTNGGEDAGR